MRAWGRVRTNAKGTPQTNKHAGGTEEGGISYKYIYIYIYINNYVHIEIYALNISINIYIYIY